MRIGPAGSGALAKLINNFMCGVQVSTLAEALAMTERSGLDVSAMLRILTEGAPGSPIVKALAQRMEGREYAPNFFVSLMKKDLRHAIAAFAEQDIKLDTAEAAMRRFEEAESAGYGEDDIAAVIEPLRKMGSVYRLGPASNELSYNWLKKPQTAITANSVLSH